MAANPTPSLECPINFFLSQRAKMNSSLLLFPIPTKSVLPPVFPSQLMEPQSPFLIKTVTNPSVYLYLENRARVQPSQLLLPRLHLARIIGHMLLLSCLLQSTLNTAATLILLKHRPDHGTSMA